MNKGTNLKQFVGKLKPWIGLSHQLPKRFPSCFVFGFLGLGFSKKGPGTKGPIWNSFWAKWTLELDPPISFQNGSQVVFVFGFLGPEFSKKGPGTKGPIWNNFWANWILELDPPISFQNGSPKREFSFELHFLVPIIALNVVFGVAWYVMSLW